MTVISRGASISRDRAEPTYSSGETATFDIRLNDGLDEAHVCLSNDGYRVLLQQPLLTLTRPEDLSSDLKIELVCSLPKTG